MKNVMYLGMCLATTFGMVAVALGQQQSDAFGQPASPAAQQWQDASRQPGDLSGYQDQKGALSAPGAPQDRSMITGSFRPDQSAKTGDQPRGELGVWLVESGGPGVVIQRVTRGSAAEQAGLRPGDVVLQVNGRGAATPITAAQMIRQIPIGKSGMLTIWRDGDQRQLQITMQPIREAARDESHQVAFHGEEGGSSAELASRTKRLEQQINSLTQELQQLRQELAQLRAAGPVQQTGFSSDAAQGLTPQNPAQLAPPPATNPTPPPPGFGAPEEKAEKPAADATNPATPPAAEKPAANDPFGAAPSQPAEEKPATDNAPKKDASNDSLFE